MNELLPIVKTLWRNKTGPLLIIIQLAVSLAVVSNAAFIIKERKALIEAPTGMVDNELIHFTVRIITDDMSYNEFGAMISDDITMLLQDPDVISATHMSSIPLSGSGSSSGLRVESDENAARHSTAMFRVSQRTIDTLGLRVLNGRNFTVDEIQYAGRQAPPGPMNVIVTEQYAQTLFPDSNAVGKAIYLAEDVSLTIVGVVSDMLGPWPQSDIKSKAIFIPTTNMLDRYYYLVRTRPGKRKELLQSLRDLLQKKDSRRIIKSGYTLDETKRKIYESEHAITKSLSVVIAVIIAVNIMGLVGITSFWVSQRRKQIGIRRALGATRLDIARYFLLENAVICLLAISVGVALALLASGGMKLHFSSANIPWHIIAVSAASMLVFSVLSVLTPVIRASRESPSTASAA